MEFIFNGKSNRLFNIKVKDSNHLSKARKKLELVEVPGRTGDLIISDGSRENLNLELICYLDAKRDDNIVSLANSIDDWLNGHEGYKTLIFDDGTKFNAIFIGQLDITEIVKNFAEIKLTFSCKPFEGVGK